MVSPEPTRNAKDVFVGWSKDKRRFMFRPGDGSRFTLSGRKSGILAELGRLLPAWFEEAVSAKDHDLAQKIHEEADNLGIIIYRVRERDVDDFRFEVVDGPSVHARVVNAYESEGEARKEASRRNLGVWR